VAIASGRNDGTIAVPLTLLVRADEVIE